MNRSKGTRRDFLKRSAGLAAAGIAAPYVWTGGAARAGSPNERLRLGAIGVGGQGSGIARGAARFAELVACCDVDRNRAEQFAAGPRAEKPARKKKAAKSAPKPQPEPSGPRPKIEIYEDFRKLLDRKDIDVVTIGTPDHWHTAIAVRAMKCGKDVYCEKPLTLTIEESKLISKTVKETGRVFQVGTQQRSAGPCLKALALVRKGRLGKIQKATCSIGAGPRGGPFAEEDPPKGLNWDFWLGQAPKVPYIKERCHYQFRWWLEYSGGKLTDWGAHHIDIAHWGLGKELTGPVTIQGEGDYPKGTNCYNTAVTFHCDLLFADGTKIHVQHGPDNGIWFEGDQGQIFVNRGRLTGKPVEELTKKDDAWIDQAIRELYKGKRPGNHMGNFFACVRERVPPISDVFTHHRTISSCHLANIAMRLGRKLTWDPVKEDFVGDAEASAMVGRDQRKGYTIEEMTS